MDVRRHGLQGQGDDLAGDDAPANAPSVVRGLITTGDSDVAMHLIARLAPVWWQGKNRVGFAKLCDAVLGQKNPSMSRDLEATLFFATHANLDLGEEAAALGYAVTLLVEFRYDYEENEEERSIDDVDPITGY